MLKPHFAGVRLNNTWEIFMSLIVFILRGGHGADWLRKKGLFGSSEIQFWPFSFFNNINYIFRFSLPGEAASDCYHWTTTEERPYNVLFHFRIAERQRLYRSLYRFNTSSSSLSWFDVGDRVIGWVLGDRQCWHYRKVQEQYSWIDHLWSLWTQCLYGLHKDKTIIVSL